jgi:hypothetical protein
MKPFQRSSLQIQLDEVLDARALLPHLFSGHTPAGQRYLIIQTSGNEDCGTWMCAPITERALHYVLAGSAQLRDAVAHTATGAVDIVTVSSDGQWCESNKLCRELADEDLPPVGARLPHAGTDVDPCRRWHPSGHGKGQLFPLREGQSAGPGEPRRLVSAAAV